jgi:ABC-2 type transport system permease protein
MSALAEQTREPLSAPTRARAPSVRGTFVALLRRDMRVLVKTIGTFFFRTVMQPVLILFVFTYVFPKIGQDVGGKANAPVFSTLLVSGVVGLSVILQAIQTVALPLVQEFGFTREVEDRVLAPLPIWAVAVEKILAGALQALLAAVVVFPLAYLIPATPVHLRVTWPIILTVTPLGCVMGASLGLTLGTAFEPRTIPLLFSLIILPMTFMGAIYYPWSQLRSVRWLQVLVLANPLVYLSEGLRAALTNVPHMPLVAVYPAMIGMTAALAATGIKGFRRRVLN